MRFVLVMTLCLVVVLAFGCSSPAAETSPTPSSNSEVEAPGTQPLDDPSQLVAAGLYDLDGGRVRAVGTLTHIDLEGGFWALVDTSSDETASEDSTATIVIVIANPEDLAAQVAALEGMYVVATGTPFDGVSIRMAGPEVIVDSIEYLADSSESATSIAP